MINMNPYQYNYTNFYKAAVTTAPFGNVACYRVVVDIKCVAFPDGRFLKLQLCNAKAMF